MPLLKNTKAYQSTLPKKMRVPLQNPVKTYIFPASIHSRQRKDISLAPVKTGRL